MVQPLLALVGFALALVGFALAVVGLALALVSLAFALARNCLALVGLEITLVRLAFALAGRRWRPSLPTSPEPGDTRCLRSMHARMPVVARTDDDRCGRRRAGRNSGCIEGYRPRFLAAGSPTLRVCARRFQGFPRVSNPSEGPPSGRRVPAAAADQPQLRAFSAQLDDSVAGSAGPSAHVTARRTLRAVR
jgi:hypothetical protein